MCRSSTLEKKILIFFGGSRSRTSLSLNPMTLEHKHTQIIFYKDGFSYVVLHAWIHQQQSFIEILMVCAPPGSLKIPPMETFC